MLQKVGQDPGARPKTYGEDPSSHGVQRASMADFFLSRQPADPGYCAEGCKTSALVNIEEAVNTQLGSSLPGVLFLHFANNLQDPGPFRYRVIPVEAEQGGPPHV